MDLDKKLICYRHPKRGYTLDEWELRIVPISTSNYRHYVEYNSHTHELFPTYDANDHLIQLTIGLDPDFPPESAVRSIKLNALILDCDLYEPIDGWGKSVSWDVAHNRGRK